VTFELRPILPHLPAACLRLVELARAVQSVAVSPDGAWAVTSDYERLCVWDLPRGTIAHESREWVRQIAMHPDGGVVATTHARAVQLRELPSLHVRASFEVPGEARHLALGRRRLAFTADGAIRVVALDGPALERVLELPTGSRDVEWLVLTPDERCLLAHPGPQTRYAWDLETGRGRYVFGFCSAPCFLDERRFVSRFPGGGWGVWADVDGESTPLALRGELFSWAASPSSDVCAFAHHHDVALLDRASARVVGRLRGHFNRITSVAVACRTVVSASDDRTLRVWNASRAAPAAPARAEEGRVLALRFTGDGREAVAVHTDRITRWDAASGSAVGAVPLEVAATRLACRPDGRQAVIEHTPHPLVIDLDTGRVVGAVSCGDVLPIAVHADGRRMIARHRGVTLVIDIATGRTLSTFDGSADVALADDLLSVVAAGCRWEDPDGYATYGFLELWDLASGAPRQLTARLHDSYGPVVIDRVGRRAICGAAKRQWGPTEHSVTLWSLDGGALEGSLPHREAIAGLVIDADGRRLVTIAHDRVLRVWDLATQSCVAAWRSDAQLLRCAVGAGGRLAVGDEDGAVTIFALPD
jgi:WD40 repeat protein